MDHSRGVALAQGRLECQDGPRQVPAQVLASGVSYPESPIRVHGQIYFVEFAKDQLSRLDKKNQVVPVWRSAGCGPAAVSVDPSQSLWVTCYLRNTVVKLSAQGKWLDELRLDEKERPWVGPNDFAQVGSLGFYFTASGEFDRSAPIQGKVYRVAPKKPGQKPSVQLMADSIHYANGLGVLLGGRTLLVSEHLKNRILQYEVSLDGRLSAQSRVFFDLSTLPPPPGEKVDPLLGPDGLRVSQHGVVFVAHYGGSRVVKINAQGQLVGVIEFDSEFKNATNVWVEEQTLYVSLVKDDAPANYPGVILRIEDPELETRKLLRCRIQGT